MISFFNVSPEMLEATSDQIFKGDTSSDRGKTSDFSTCCDEDTEFTIEDLSEEEEIEYQQNREIDGDSPDEGLGDISNDDSIELLVKDDENEESQKMYGIPHQAIIISAICHENLQNTNFDHQTPCKQRKDQKERRPSRISFETPL